MEAQKRVTHSPGSVRCTEEGPSEPQLKRMSRSWPSGVEGRESLPGGENKKGVRESGEQVESDVPGLVILWVESPEMKPERQIVGRFYGGLSPFLGAWA